MKILTGLLILAASLQPYVVWADSAAAAAAEAAAAASDGDGAATATAVATATASSSSSAHIPCNCNFDYRPVCGSDGKTYSNICVLNCINAHRIENCLPPIYVHKIGECTYRPCKCSNGGQSLCGTDGNTYGNKCYFDCENKRRDHLGLHRIKVDYPGVCKHPVCLCPKVIIPVCGSDGRTYKNVCILQCVSYHNQANCKPAIWVKHVGVCAKENCICPLNIDPLCACDGKTYNNLCHLHCENRKRSQLGKRPLKVLHKGECGQCNCPKIYDPVCACNGQTFANKCVLDCENEVRKRKNLPPLTIKSVGVCPCICTLEYKPVCGTDGRTYGNLCQLKCEQKRRDDLGLHPIGLKHVGRCRCDCWYCPRKYEPVCGSDGRTYWNICWLRCNRGCRDDIGCRLFAVCKGPC